MKGLLIKDIKLVRNNMKNSLVIILLVAAAMSTYIEDVFFLVTYLGLVGTNFAMGTLSYDEFDNGYSFLLSLPVTRKGYVVEKYSFSILLGGGGWLLGAVLALVAGTVRGSAEPLDVVMTSLVLLPMVLLMVSVMIPFRLKFGSEKGRIVLICTAGAVFLLFTLAAEVFKKVELDLNGIGKNLPSFAPAAVAAGAGAIGIAIMLISGRLSVSILEKKEF